MFYINIYSYAKYAHTSYTIHIQRHKQTLSIAQTQQHEKIETI